MPRNWALPLCVEQYGVRFRISRVESCDVEELAGLFLPFLRESGQDHGPMAEISFRPFEKSTDILSILAPLYVAHGLFPIHAAGVELRNGATLYVGASGSGKSTLARVALASGYKIVGDDVVLVRRRDASIEVLPWSCSIQDQTPAKRPSLLAPERFASGPLRAVFYPSIGTQPLSSFAPITGPLALPRLSTQILWGSEPRALLKQRDLIRELLAVPSHDLVLGRDILDQPTSFFSGCERMLDHKAAVALAQK